MKHLWDSHLHTSFSADSETAPEIMLKRANELGLMGITFTDHMDIDYPGEDPTKFELDIKEYLLYMAKLMEAEAKDQHNTAFLVGMELGLQTHLVDIHKSLLDTLPLDYVIGSIHVVNSIDPYYPSYYEGRTGHEAYEEYFKCILENLNCFTEFDSLGHLDYITRYAKRHLSETESRYDYKEYQELIREIFRILISKDIALEVNTGAYRADLNEPNPTFDTLRFYKECGGSLITIGADAHRPEHVGLHFDRIADELKEIGFQEYAIYQKRKPTLFPL